MSQFTLVRNVVCCFIGGLSRNLFGTLDDDDANYYTELENEQLDFLKLSK